jgi:uncharacterized protein
VPLTEILRFGDSSSDPAVRGYLHVPAKSTGTGDGIVLTHGAGSNCEAALLVAVADALCDRGLVVLRVDLPFRQDRPTGPPRNSAERDQRGLRHAVEALRKLAPGRAFLGGHSYGGRQSSILAASRPDLVDALLLLSYPLHPPKRPDQPRTAHFPQLRTPALFVSGSRDGFDTLDELSDALQLIPARSELLPVPSAGHELLTPRNRTELPAASAAAFAAFTRP